MFAGDPINSTEGRAVLHIALRNRSPRAIRVEGRDVMPDVLAALDHLRQFSAAVRSGAWTGHTGARITDVVNIGIGGSDLGPVMATAALAPYAATACGCTSCRTWTARTSPRRCKNSDPRTTLFVVASKTFTTQETMTNAQTARAWFLDAPGDEAHIARHFVAVSTNETEVRRFGIAPREHVRVLGLGRRPLFAVELDRPAGGVGCRLRALRRDARRRVSRWTSTSAPRRFPEHPDGARDDRHLERERSHYDTHAVLPYEQLLHRFPAYLQQLDMESNGKRVDRDGAVAHVPTGPIVWGEPGTNGQHAFYQLLHQGTRVVPC